MPSADKKRYALCMNETEWGMLKVQAQELYNSWFRGNPFSDLDYTKLLPKLNYLRVFVRCNLKKSLFFFNFTTVFWAYTSINVRSTNLIVLHMSPVDVKNTVLEINTVQLFFVALWDNVWEDGTLLKGDIFPVCDKLILHVYEGCDFLFVIKTL